MGHGGWKEKSGAKSKGKKIMPFGKPEKSTPSDKVGVSGLHGREERG